MCGSLPLHIASRNGCDAEILKLLFEAYPEALERKNSNGDTPFESGAGHVSYSPGSYCQNVLCRCFLSWSCLIYQGTSQRSLTAMTEGIESH